MKKLKTTTEPADLLRKFAPFLLIVVGLLILLPVNNLLPLIDRDEPRFAQATQEMIQRGEWVIPYFNEEYRFDKPVGIYWLMRGCYATLGVNEFAARLPSVISAILAALVLLKTGERWFSVRAGFLAGFGFLTCVQILMHGRSAVADMPMVLAVLLTQIAIWELLDSPDERYPWGWFWTLYLSLGFGFLTKGPIAWAVPILTLPLYRGLLWRKPLRWSRLRFFLGLPIVLVIIGSWGIPALLKTHGQFWDQGMVTHVWDRGIKTFQGHSSFFLYYFVVGILSLFPWSALLGDAITVTKRNWSAKNAYLVSWLLGTYVLFTLYKTKLPHYVMPAFPAFFLILGQTTSLEGDSPRWARRWFWLLIGLVATVAVTALVAAVAIPFAGPVAGLRPALLGAAGIFASLAGLAVLWKRGKIRLLALPLVGIAVSMIFLGSGLRSMNPAIQLQPQFSQMPPETEFAFHGFKEPSLVFYTGSRWEPLKLDQLNDFLRKPGPRVLVIQDREIRIDDVLESLLPAEDGEGRRPINVRDFSEDLNGVNTDGYEETSFEGINIARTCYVKVKVFSRR